jgi:2'-5' RNA ligase
MRLFAALDLTDEARGLIAAEQKRIAGALEGADRSALRFVRPEHIHLTLVFVGEVDEPRGVSIVEAMRADIAQRPFRLVFSGLGAFPPHGAPRVLWLGVSDGAQHAVELQQRVARRLEGVGVGPEGRPFRPHLTLARWRERGPADRRVTAPAHSAEVAKVDVEAVTLFQSRLSSSGPAYTALAHARLTCP